MINEKVYAWLKEKGFEDRITEHEETIDTVEHAAGQIGCSEAEIAKTLSFMVDDKPVIVVMAGDGRVNSSKFKAQFHTKPGMVPRDRVEELIGFLPGGVCPFGVDKSIPVWLDVSMKRFEYVHPAAGSEFLSAKLTPEELEKASDAVGWCDVCKGWDAVDRITDMEAVFDRASFLVTGYKENLDALLDYQPEIERLARYYESPLWKADLAEDEAGNLPADLKRGVLSEDGIYNLLESNKEILESISE